MAVDNAVTRTRHRGAFENREVRQAIHRAEREIRQQAAETARELRRIALEMPRARGDALDVLARRVQRAAAAHVQAQRDAIDRTFLDIHAASSARIDELVLGEGGTLAQLRRVNPRLIQQIADETFSDLAGRTEEIETWMTAVIRNDGARVIADLASAGVPPSEIAMRFEAALEARGFTSETEIRDLRQLLRVRKTTLGRADEDVLRAALDELGIDNLVTFVDAGGTRWDLRVYSEMVAATKTRVLQTETALDRLNSHGVGHVRISFVGSDHLSCSAWEGRVYALSADDPAGFPPLELTAGGGPPFHPNCGHSIRPWVIEAKTDDAIDVASRGSRGSISLLRAPGESARSHLARLARGG